MLMNYAIHLLSDIISLGFWISREKLLPRISKIKEKPTSKFKNQGKTYYLEIQKHFGAVGGKQAFFSSSYSSQTCILQAELVYMLSASTGQTKCKQTQHVGFKFDENTRTDKMPGGKTGKTAVLPGFWKIGGGSAPPYWWSYLTGARASCQRRRRV
jgi:hypothetical protein